MRVEGKSPTPQEPFQVFRNELVVRFGKNLTEVEKLFEHGLASRNLRRVNLKWMAIRPGVGAATSWSSPSGPSLGEVIIDFSARSLAVMRDGKAYILQKDISNTILEFHIEVTEEDRYFEHDLSAKFYLNSSEHSTCLVHEDYGGGVEELPLAALSDCCRNVANGLGVPFQSKKPFITPERFAH